MKTTFSEAQVRGLLSICEHESGDAVRVTPVVYQGSPPADADALMKRETGRFIPVEGQESMKAVDLQVAVYSNPGGWTDGYHMRQSGRWCPPGSDYWHEPAEAV
jgi:hypothetical protein